MAHPRKLPVLAAIALYALVLPHLKADEQLHALPDSFTEPAIYKQFSGIRELSFLLTHKGAASNASPNGALGRNRKRFSDVAAQRDVLWTLRLFLAKQDFSESHIVLEAFAYGFGHQATAGFFENAHGAKPLKAISADAFFLNAYIRSLYLAQAGDAGKLGQGLLAYQTTAKKSFAWLYANRLELAHQDRRAPNRLLFDGFAFLLYGNTTKEEPYREAGIEFINKALALQRSDGTFSEHGGYDSSYQAVCLLNLLTAYPYIDDEGLKKRISDATTRGMAWQKSRIEKSGRVLVEGNTRTGRGQEKLFGKEKDVNYAEVSLALAIWGFATNDSEAIEMARSVVRYAAKK